MTETLDAAGGAGDRDDDRPLPGLRIGPDDEPDRYEIVETGRAGGEGITYRSLYRGDLAAPVQVAVKQVLRPAGAHPAWPTQADRERWRDQVQILQTGPSPHLVRVREFFLGEHPHPAGHGVARAPRHRQPYLVMEWVPGPTLHEAVTAGGLTPVQAVALVGQLADAVESLHSATRTAGNPMLHRDIKPANCIVDPQRGLVLVDMGTLRRFDEGVDTRRPHSPGYTAPEVLADLAAPRAIASDLYALGAVAYFCLVGHDPGDPTTPDARQVMRAELAAAARRHHVHRSVASTVLAMLDPDPQQRPPSPRRWAEQLHRLVARTRRRRRMLAGSAVAATALLGAALTLPSSIISADAEPTVAVPLAFTAFGQSFASFPATADADRLTISPPLGDDRYAHLWGLHTPATNCAATVEFDAQLRDGDPGQGFGFGVAPRSVVEADQPYGDSLQYEWAPASVTDQPGAYIRPATLPGGAWAGTQDPVPAPDLADLHHVVVRAVGTDLAMTIDDTTVHFAAPAVECGGVTIRAWGATVDITNVQVSGS